MKGLLIVPMVVTILGLMIQVMFVAGQATMTCPQVDLCLATCVPYLTGAGINEPGTACCIGVRGLVGAAKSTQDKRDACNCIKQVANGFSGLKDDAAQSLPSKCGYSHLQECQLPKHQLTASA